MSIVGQIKTALKGSPTLLRVARNLHRRYLSYRTKIDPPILMGIELTNNCPFKCVMCVRTTGMTRSLGFMSEDLFRKIIDEYVATNPKAAATTELTFTHFGESLLHPKFEEFIAYAVAKGCGNTLLSINPLMLTNPVQERLLNSGIHIIHFSLDGHDNETFEKIRGIKNAYDDSKEKLIEFIGRIQKLERKPYLRLGMIDFDLNAASIETMRTFWENLGGLDEIWVKPATAWSGTVESVNQQLHYDGVKAAPAKVIQCNIPFHGLTVTWDGKIAACCGDQDNLLPLGDASKSTLKDIWNNEQYTALRREFVTGDVQNKLCKNCDQLYAP